MQITVVILPWADWTHPPVLLQRLHWTGRERPQQVIGQDDEHVCCSALLCGPRDRKRAVCAAARHLGTVTAWENQPSGSNLARLLTQSWESKLKPDSKLQICQRFLRFCCTSTYFDQFGRHFCQRHVGPERAGNHGSFRVGQHLRVCLRPRKSLPGGKKNLKDYLEDVSILVS